MRVAQGAEQSDEGRRWVCAQVSVSQQVSSQQESSLPRAASVPWPASTAVHTTTSSHGKELSREQKQEPGQSAMLRKARLVASPGLSPWAWRMLGSLHVCPAQPLSAVPHTCGPQLRSELSKMRVETAPAPLSARQDVG